LALGHTQQKTDQLDVEGAVQKMLTATNRPQKQTFDPAPPNIDILVRLAVTVYPI